MLHRLVTNITHHHHPHMDYLVLRGKLTLSGLLCFLRMTSFQDYKCDTCNKLGAVGPLIIHMLCCFALPFPAELVSATDKVIFPSRLLVCTSNTSKYGSGPVSRRASYKAPLNPTSDLVISEKS